MGRTGQNQQEYEDMVIDALTRRCCVDFDRFGTKRRGKRVCTGTSAFRRYDGVWRRFSIRGAVPISKRRRTTKWVGVHTDVTEYAAEAALESEELLRLATGRADVGF
jgi:PAS domain-containing protein